MRISVKDKSTAKVICECGWKGQIQDANWMQEGEFGTCPDCGKEEAFTIDEFSKSWEWDGWKAQVIVYAMLAGAVIFGIVPWIWGLIEEVKFVWNLIFG